MITIKSDIGLRIQHLVEGLVSALGVELVRVTYEREDDVNALTLYINKDGGIGLDDCERVSLLVDPIIEESGIMENEENWSLNVSSPGIE